MVRQIYGGKTMSNLIHGDNLEHKIKIEKQPENKKLLNEIKAKYSNWKEDNLKITGTTKEDIKKKVKLLNEYKMFIDQPKFKKVESHISSDQNSIQKGIKRGKIRNVFV